jgi:chromosome segregation ATPase
MDNKIAIKKIEELKSKIEKLVSEKRAAEIAIAEMEKDLREEYNVNVENLDKTISELEKEINEKELEFKKELERIENELASIES